MADDISVLGIAVETRGVKEGEDALNRLEKAGRGAEKSTTGLNDASRKTSSSVSSLSQAVKTATGAFAGWQISAFAKSLIDAQQSAQKLRNTLEYSAGGAKAAAGELVYLREVTGKLGLDFDSASSAYAKFAASTKNAGISLAQTKTVFEGVAAASARMGLSSEETQGALLALSQMASKGTVSAEELRGQLGERLPGAFDIAAKSIGVTTAELGKMLQNGEIIAKDFLPKFGQALKDNFQAPLNSLTQEINRFSSAWSQWKQELSDGTNGGSFAWLTKGLNESTAAMRALGKEAGLTQRILTAFGGFEFGALGASKFDIANQQAEAFEKLAKAKKKLQNLVEIQESKILNSVERQQLEHYTLSIKNARDEIMRLAEAKGKASNFKLPDLKGEILAQQKKYDESVKAYLADLSNAPKAAKISSEVEKENSAFKIAVAGLSETDARYISALEAHNQRVEEIKKKASSGAKGTKEDPYADLFGYADRMARFSKELDAELKEIEKSSHDYAKAVEAMLGPLENEANALELQVQNYGLTRAEIDATVASRLAEATAIAALNGASGEAITFLQRELELRQRIAAASAELAAKDAAVAGEKSLKEAAKEAQAAWEKTTDKIGDSLSDSLMRGFEKGQSAAQALRDTVVNMFKTMVLQPVIKVGFVGGLSALGMGNASASDSSGGIGNLFSAGSSAYNMYSGTSGLFGSFATSGIGEALGLSSQVAAGTAASAYSAGGSIIAGETTSALTSLGSTIGAAIPYIGLAAAAISLFAGSMGKGGTPHAGGIVFANQAGTDNTHTIDGIVSNFQNPTDANNLLETDWTKRYSQSTSDSLAPTATAISTMLNSASKQFGQDIEYQVGLAFSADGEDKSRGRLTIVNDANNELLKTTRGRFSKDASTGIGEFVASTGTAVREVLEQIDMPEWADKMLDAVGDTPSIDKLSAVVTQINAIAEAAEQLAPAFKMAQDDFAALYTSVGAGVLDTYYQTVYSESERLVNLTSKVQTQFADLGFQMPETIAGFRALVEAQDSTTASGRETIASLMGLTSTFASVANAATESAAKIAAADAADRKEMVAARRATDEAAAKSAKEAAEAAAEAWATKTEEFLAARGGFVKAGDSASLMAYEVERIRREMQSEYGQVSGSMALEQARRELGSATSVRSEMSASALSQTNLEKALALQLSASSAQALEDNAKNETNAIYGVKNDSPESLKRLASEQAKMSLSAMYSQAQTVGIAEVRRQINIASMAAYQNATMPTLYADALRDLNRQFQAGKLSADEFAKAAEKINFGEWSEQAVDYSQVVQAGISSIHFYIDAMGALAQETEEAESALSKVTDMMGRMKSSATVFSESANAATLTGNYTDLTDKAYLIAEAARIAGKVATTQSAAEAAARLKASSLKDTSGDRLKEMSLLIDGVKAYDSDSFERAFNRLGSAFGNNKISGNEYVSLLEDSINVFSGMVDESGELTDAFSAVRKAARSLADQLLLDESVSTLSPEQRMAEADRQFAEALTKAATGNTDAMSSLSGLSNSRLDAAKASSTSEVDYNRKYAETVAEIRSLESIVNPAGNQAIVAELAELRKQVAQLQQVIVDGTAQVATNTNQTNKHLKEIRVNGMPTVELV